MRSFARPSRLDLLGQQPDDCPVVEHPGQRVAAGRLDELAMLAAQARLCGAEDEEQEPGEQHRRRQGHEHDVASGRVEPGHEVGGIAPEGNDREHLALAVF